ncbi:hypothetical protein [Flavobacterium sp.]|uniref:hypothetical protein n=1 Tax=Flavobacterium sp. TaxID=239 RepID=UPI0025EB2DB7|nr:hypothetical protein [Flavobacterium sp.]
MFVKIKELPKDLKKKALKRMVQQGKDADENEILGGAFAWKQTKEGHNFWSEVCDNFTNIKPIDTKRFIELLGIEVINHEEVKPDSVVESIVNQFRDRSSVGIKKYGTTLDRDDLTTKDWIEHAKQEAMDLILYLEKLKQTL